MAYCPKCGVSVEKDQIPCPLCYTYIPKVLSDEELSDANGFPTYYSLYENLLHFFIRSVYRVLCILMILGFLVPTIVDLSLNGELTWSLYSSLSVLMSWCYLHVFFGYVKRMRNKLTVLIAAASIGLIGFDGIYGYAGWSVEIAIPIVVLTVLLFLANIAIYRVNVSWLRQSGYIIFSLLILCIGIEFILRIYLNAEAVFIQSAGDVILAIIAGAVLLIASYTVPDKWKEKMKRKFHI
ncbi:DUF6320 domain-containing protein [Terribacillus halophilus]|jgi:hypothetical protein|uniref:DUF6320 domain-containing protein n=1 Tax=Terribacillus halophilus TaxID=361279 RepID=UPI0009842D45|nr:DUF6320 domain-containing protein [Terribacillus halophilus]